MASSLREQLRQTDFGSQVAEWNRLADTCLDTLLAQHIPTEELANAALHAYVRYKFCVTDEDYAQTDNLIALARISIQRALAEGTIFYDQRDCHGVSESMEKKMLLVTAVERRLNYTFPAEDYIQIDTVQDLAHEVYRVLARRVTGEGKRNA